MQLRERPYFDLKLDQATQLSNGEHGSKLSLHFSQPSDFSSFASYVIPTVYTRWSVNYVAVRDLPCLICSKINPFDDISSHTMIENFGREILLIGSLFFQETHSNRLPVDFPKIRPSGTFLLKSSFSEKATKIRKNLPLVLTLLSSKNNCFVKTSGRFFQILWPSHNVLTLSSGACRVWTF